jgi:hypothetical protein
MANSSEAGHHKNVANFNTLISRCNGYGGIYNPSNQSITISELTLLHKLALESIDKVSLLTPTFNIAKAARFTLFKPLDKLITRVTNSLKSISPSAKTTENVISISRKIKGQRVSAKLSDEELKLKESEGIKIQQNSTNQTDFDSRIENFGKLINQLAAIVEYKPNEKELQVESLTALLNDLILKNNAAKETETPVINARIARNEIMYKSETGLVDIAFNTKNYVKSVFGATSPQYKQISGLKFKKYKVSN